MATEENIEELLEIILLDDEYYEGMKSVKTFKECGLLTNNKGLIVTDYDESEFQITIVKTK